MKLAYFIAGTDTSVGKTLVAASLLQMANNIGLKTLGLKPVAAGCKLIDNQWVNDDAYQLMQISSIKPDYTTVNPISLREPMAPHIAAEFQGINFHARGLARTIRNNLTSAEFSVIEGAGGWLVPLNQTETMADLAQAIGCPVILVVGMRLGCISHSLLTIRAIKQSGLELAGWVANHIDPSMAAQDENVATLQERIPAPLLGRIPHLDNAADAMPYLQLPAGF